MKDNNTPVLPLQPIAVDHLVPCFARSSFHWVKPTGSAGEVRDAQLEANKAPGLLTNPAFATAPL